jgi:hypothetical protein
VSLRSSKLAPTVELAKRAAEECLRLIGYSTPGPVRLSKLGKHLRIVEERRGVRVSPSVKGALWVHPTPLGFEAPEADVEVAFSESQVGRMRFTVAHEFAHQYARLLLPPELTEAWSPAEVRRFCHEFAAHLLVPDALLEHSISSFLFDGSAPSSQRRTDRLKLGIADIEALYRRLRVPMAAVLVRLRELALRKQLFLEFCALEITAATSTTRRENYAPRILASCTPPHWFFPPNKRLITLGFSNLAAQFWSAPPLVERVAYDRLTVFLREGWRRLEVDAEIRYKIYPAAPRARVMLAVIPGLRHS